MHQIQPENKGEILHVATVTAPVAAAQADKRKLVPTASGFMDVDSLGVSNLLGTNSSWTVSAAAGSGTVARLAFTNANGMTLSLSTGAAGLHTIVGSYTVPTVTNSSWTLSDSATSLTISRLAFTNSNGVTATLSTAAGAATVIFSTSQTVQTQNLHALVVSNNTSGASTIGTSGSVSFAGTNITITVNTANNLLREWREKNAPHTDSKYNKQSGFSCDFDATWGYSMNPSIQPFNQERQNFALQNYKEAAMDTMATLTKRAPK